METRLEAWTPARYVEGASRAAIKTYTRTDDYYESELAWMDLSGTPIEVAIGPYETYPDGLHGQKTAFELETGDARPRLDGAPPARIAVPPHLAQALVRPLQLLHHAPYIGGRSGIGQLHLHLVAALPRQVDQRQRRVVFIVRQFRCLRYPARGGNIGTRAPELKEGEIAQFSA